MEGKKLNVTEEWLQVITQLTLSYRRNQNDTVNTEDEENNIDVVSIITPPVRSDEIKQGNPLF